MRDLLTYIQAGDATQWRGMTVLMINFLIVRPFWTASSTFLLKLKSNSGVCLEVKVKMPYVASVLLHAVAKMAVGLPEALSASAFPARDPLVGTNHLLVLVSGC
ncbi:hypothetical protein BH23BAC3_BH23BAC3_18900 [soil metagenome]